LGRSSRNDQHDDRGSRKTGRRSSPDRWTHDRFSDARSRSRSGQFEWKEVEVKNEDRLRPRDKEKDRSRSQGSSRNTVHSGVEDRRRSSHHEKSRSRDGEIPRSRSGHYSGSKSIERSKSREESSSSQRRRDKSSVYPLPVDTIQGHREETAVQFDVNLYGDGEEGLRQSSISKKRLSESSESSRRGKRSRRVTGSDHEEVNEIQDDFEIDSVGKIEDSEETLQKMKSAILGILDEEISTLSKKIKK